MSEPISLSTLTTITAAAAAPLALGLVPPNRLYGFRTERTMSSPQEWYRVNRFAGLALIAAAAVTMTIYRLRPDLSSGRSFMGMLALVVPALAAVLLSVRCARKAV